MFPAAALDREETDLVARYRQVDAIPLPLSVSSPANEDTFVGKVACRVLE